MARPTEQLHWLWDLHPLRPGAWGNIQYPIEGMASGETIRVQRAQGMNGDEYQKLVLFPGQSKPSMRMGLFSRPFYFPTPDDVAFLQQHYSDCEHPRATPWARIEADLVISGRSTSELGELNAPTLIALLRSANRRAEADPTQGSDADAPRPSVGQRDVVEEPSHEGTTSAKKATHAPDFTSVNWFGQRYTFSKGHQAGVIGLLWEAWEAGDHGLSQEALAEKLRAGDSFRLRKVFRHRQPEGGYQPHPAWNMMIRSESKGVFRLVSPPVGSDFRESPKNPDLPPT